MTRLTIPDHDETVVPLHVEEASVALQEVERGGVRVRVQTTTREHPIDEDLTLECVEIDRVAIGRPIDAVPPVREEGDTMVISVVEEFVVVEHRLILKEEIRLRRVRKTKRHRESVILREQEAVIERTEPSVQAGVLPVAAGSNAIPTNQGTKRMTDETVVAVYDTPEHAAAAVRDLEAAGVPSSAISQHAKSGMTTSSTTTTAEPSHGQGFWSSLFGGEPEHAHDMNVYSRSLESGSTVVTVKASEQHLTHVTDILEQHNPIDIDERAASYGVDQTTTTHTTGAPMTGTAGTRATDDTIQLAEEQLAVGKRAVNRGTTRIRRYVVETPVEEQVALRTETVSVERRPVTDGRPITNADFTDKVVEMTETDEEAVVSKAARVKEEIAIRKDATERTETIRDTVRREDVEITKEPGVERTTGTTSGTTTGTTGGTTSDAATATTNNPSKPRI